MIAQEKNSLSGSIGSVLSGMDAVLEEVRAESTRSTDVPFQVALDHAWAILNKYYILADKYRTYIAPLVWIHE